jgi:hypothetical protein
MLIICRPSSTNTYLILAQRVILIRPGPDPALLGYLNTKPGFTMGP